MPELKPKIAIIGCGNVGIRYAYAVMIKGLAREILLVDTDRKKAEGEAMDLAHGAPYIRPVEIAAGGYADIKDADLVVVTAGRKQKPGQTRIDLARDNIALYRKIVPDILKNAPDTILLVVTNPVDVLSYAAYKISGRPAKKVIGSGTVLDSARFRYQLAQHCAIDPRNVHAYILGEHGDTEFAVWSRAMVGGVLLDDYCLICKTGPTCRHDEALNSLFVEVRDSAYKIIEKKGETSSGIGLAMARITQAILNNENAVMPVSSLVEDYLGVDDVYLSLPAVLNRDGVREVIKPTLNEREQGALRHSARTLRSVIKQVGL